ncbi:MAG: hypothetical protein KKE82_10340 [Proteobacteria bacterium]|nr:hypothetical protein [Pseudomonadota bacterium]MBU1547156.1 hypothetical protein [Pseudomonadota bacterium]
MKRRYLPVSILVLLCGCTPQMRYVAEIPRSLSQQQAFADAAAKQVAQEGDFSVWVFRGRYYVLGTQRAKAALINDPSSLQVKSAPGMGPHGETVEFEADPADPGLTTRLEEQFKGTPLLLKQFEREYYVWKYDNRLFVIGGPESNALFAATKTLPLSKTIFAAGPNEETVIVEAKNNNPDFAERLVERFLASPQLVTQDADYFVWRYRNRLYVMGSPDTSLSFEKTLLIPKSQAFLGAGQKGETVIFETGKDATLLQRLRDKFFSRSSMSALEPDSNR